MQENERLYYIDWLRSLVILLLIPYHGALTYTGLGDVYIKAPLHDIAVLPFLAITAPLDSFMMTLLFFLSGISTFYSLRKRGRRDYIKERFKKVLLPLVLGTLLLCPIQAYFQGLHEGFTGSILQFAPEFFSAKIVHYLGYAHLWFLLYLFIYSMVCMPLFLSWLKANDRFNKLSEYLCKGNHILYPIFFIVLAEALLRPFFPGKQTFILDWANVVIYLSVYVFGFAFAKDKKIEERVNGLVNWCKVIFPVLALFYIALQYLMIAKGISGALWAVTKGLYECAAILFFLWIGKKYLNKKSVGLHYLNKAAFRYYLFHFIPVSLFTYMLITVEINPYLKYLLVVMLSYLFVFVMNVLLEVIIRVLSNVKGWFQRKLSNAFVTEKGVKNE